MKIKWEQAVIVTLILAAVSAVFFLGRISIQLEEVQPQKYLARLDKVEKIHLTSAVPVGTILMYWSDQVPEGYQRCDGSVVEDSESSFDQEKKPNFEGGIFPRFVDLETIKSTKSTGGRKEVTLTHANLGLASVNQSIETRDNNKRHFMTSYNNAINNPLTPTAFEILPPFQTVGCIIKVK